MPPATRRRREQARRYGAETVIDPGNGDPVEAVRAATAG